MMGEGGGDLDEGYCVFMGPIGDMFNRKGKGPPGLRGRGQGPRQ